MTQIFPILNRFLRRNTSSASNIIMWLTGLGSLTYLLLNIYHGVYLPKDTPNATPISAINDRDAVKDSEVSIQDFNMVRIIWKTYVPRKINICKKIQFMFFFNFSQRKWMSLYSMKYYVRTVDILYYANYFQRGKKCQSLWKLIIGRLERQQ